jgi:hypothetical protein
LIVEAVRGYPEQSIASLQISIGPAIAGKLTAKNPNSSRRGLLADAKNKQSGGLCDTTV